MKHRAETWGKSSPKATLAAGLVTVASTFTITLASCAGPPMVTPIEGEPVCPDFEVGAAHTKMTGGLRFPVQVTIKDGSNVVFKTTLLGRRLEKDSATRVLVTDDDATLSVEWAQCENERAPRAVEAAARDTKTIAKYECGKAETYKTDPLVTKRGDAKSHALTFQTPPNAACWQGAPPVVETADAGAPDAAPASADADAGAGTDADAGADAGPVSADAGASDAGPGADGGPTDAGATKSN